MRLSSHGSTRAFNSLVLSFQSSPTFGGFHLPKADFIRSANFICRKANFIASLLALHSWYLMVVLSVFHQTTALCAARIHKTWSNENILPQQKGNVNTFLLKKQGESQRGSGNNVPSHLNDLPCKKRTRSAKGSA